MLCLKIINIGSLISLKMIDCQDSRYPNWNLCKPVEPVTPEMQIICGKRLTKTLMRVRSASTRR